MITGDGGPVAGIIGEGVDVSTEAFSDPAMIAAVTCCQIGQVLGYRGKSGHKQGWFCMGSVSRLNAPPEYITPC